MKTTKTIKPAVARGCNRWGTYPEVCAWLVSHGFTPPKVAGKGFTYFNHPSRCRLNALIEKEHVA
jgi:hypothetical protein